MSDSDIKYTAFISYRHSEKDFAVAKDVQNQLEHLKIPKDIKKNLTVNNSGDRTQLNYNGIAKY
ncbi:MAG: hypothetical protein IKF00_03845 [Solobacterium sp.]|nr:hypothetical protein [Solobacterium sp.]